MHIFRADERSCGMLVYRFEEGLPVVQAFQMEFKHIKIITIGVQGCDAQFGALAAVVFVVVIRAYYCDPILTQDSDQTICKSTLPGGAIANDG
jgi:hypothetical protein